MGSHSAIGVAIVTHNSGRFPEILLRSIVAAKTKHFLKVVVVDNGSAEDQIRPFVDFVTSNRWPPNVEVTFVARSKNLGFAGGTNIAIQQLLESGVSHICLMNSDAVVTDYWIDRLLSHGVDVVSPVTNRAHASQQVANGYEKRFAGTSEGQKVNLLSTFLSSLNRFSNSRYRAFQGYKYLSESTFFCTLINAQTIRQVGLLDENFYPGGYEDNDYFERLRTAGIQYWVARDTFVHHWGSQSFRKLEYSVFEQQKAKNIDYFSDKHGYRPTVTQFKTNSFLEDLEFVSPRPFEYWCHIAWSLGQMLQDWPKSRVWVIFRVLGFGQLSYRVGRKLATDNLRKSLETLRVQHLSGQRKFPESSRTSYADRLIKTTGRIGDGLRRVRGFDGLVVLGGFPYEERMADGYFQRIAQLEKRLSQPGNLYVELGPKPSDSSSVPEETWVIHFGDRSAIFKMLAFASVFVCAVRGRAVLSHSVLPLSSLPVRTMLRLVPTPVVLDLHGVVPEEYRLTGDWKNFNRFNSIEAFAVQRANKVITVSKNMGNHLREKYGDKISRKLVLIPVVPEPIAPKKRKTPQKIRNSIIYSGGLHPWQLAELTLATLCQLPPAFVASFYCPNPAEAKTLIPDDCEHPPRLGRLPHPKLLKELWKYDFGMVLREENIVNLVASPTKLSEYMSRGVIPIMKTSRIGDFEELGLKFVSLEALKRGVVPGEEELTIMRRHNLKILDVLRFQADSGFDDIIGALHSRHVGLLQESRTKGKTLRDAV